MIRKAIKMDEEISSLRLLFDKVVDKRGRNSSHKLSDILMSGYAMFALKYPSLLSFEQQNSVEKANLERIYGIKKMCSDVQLRDVLDDIDPTFLRDEFVTYFEKLHKIGVLSAYSYKIGSHKYLIVSCDGVQHFSSKARSCSCCLTKAHSNGTTTHHHNMLCAALVHPDKREVFIMDVEPIVQQDGVTKNDCERNAAKRLQKNMDKKYEKHKEKHNFLFVEDALYANAPHIKQLRGNGFNFLLNVKPDSHKTLFAYIKGKRARKELKTCTFIQDGVTHHFEYLNQVLLCNSSPNLRVNFIQYTQTDKKGKQTTFSWITNINVNRCVCMPLMRAARARWKIENETFNTLKNLGYRFEHNYGHGKDHLATMFAYLMLIAFYIDQIVQIACHIFQLIEEKLVTKLKLWEQIKAVFSTIYAQSMSFIYRFIANLWHLQLE